MCGCKKMWDCFCNILFQVELLQSENAAEWGRRDRLQTDLQGLERESRAVKAQNEELRERNRKLTTMSNESTAAEMTRLKAQAEANAKEAAEIRHQVQLYSRAVQS